MNVREPLVPDLEAPLLVDVGDCPLDHVPDWAETADIFGVAVREDRLDPHPPHKRLVIGGSVLPVSVQPAPQAIGRTVAAFGIGDHHRQELAHVVDVGHAHEARRWGPATVQHQEVLASVFPVIRRVGSDIAPSKSADNRRVDCRSFPVNALGHVGPLQERGVLSWLPSACQLHSRRQHDKLHPQFILADSPTASWS